jgi:hypothetical protein
MILNINRKIILVIAFLSAATSLVSLRSAALASFDYSNTPVQESFRVLVTVTGVEGNCGEEVKIIVAYKSDTFVLCEGDERPSEEQIADPISSEGYEFEFPKGQIALGESLDVCIENSGGFSDCNTLTKSQSNQLEEVTLSIE